MTMSPRLLRPRDTFSPRSISGLALWLDASDSGSTYTTDAGPVVAAASPLDIAGCALWLDGADSSAASMTLDGTAVSTWKDKSGNGRDFTASGSARPTLTASGLNGKSVLTFDGDDQLTNPTNVIGLSSVTLFSVFFRSSGTYGGVITSGSTDSSPALLVENTTAAVRGVGQVSQSAGGYTGPAVVSGRVESGSTSFFTDGLLRDSDASSGSFLAGTSTAIGTYRLTAANYLNGYIAEIIAYPTALTTAQRASVEAYLAQRWGISGVHVPATASSDPVGYWGDKSGNGRHVTTSDATTRPVIHSATHNGRKVLDFDGTNDTLSRDNYTAENDLTGLTRFAVYYVDANSSTYHLASVYSGGSYSSFTSASSLLGTHAGIGAYSQHTNVGSVLGKGTAPRVFCARYDGSAGSFASGLNVILDGAQLPIVSTVGTFPSSLPGGSPALFIGSNIRANNFVNGKICEYISYARALTTAERQRVERYLGSRWGITLAPTVSNADAQDWINRVYSNNGTVSTATAASVNQFCTDIENAPGGSIRDRFYRLNLFCGGTSGTAVGLNSALVPLYRGPSLGGTQYGGTTDTNVGGLFTGGDYNETGANGGLQSNGSKWLDTGFATNTVAEGNRHISVYENAKATRLLDVSIGSEGATGNSQQFLLSTFNSADSYRFAFGSTSGAVDAGSYSGGAMWLGVNQSAGQGILYKNGTSVVTGTLTAATPTSSSVFVFALNRGGSGADASDGRFGSYSIGLSMTAPHAAAYNTAMQAFQTALTRNV